MPLFSGVSGLREGKEMSKWKTIESAPKDDSHILVSNGKEVSLARFSYKSWRLAECGSYAEDDDLSFEPVIWHPVPALPK